MVLYSRQTKCANKDVKICQHVNNYECRQAEALIQRANRGTADFKPAQMRFSLPPLTLRKEVRFALLQRIAAEQFNDFSSKKFSGNWPGARSITLSLSGPSFFMQVASANSGMITQG